MHRTAKVLHGCTNDTYIHDTTGGRNPNKGTLQSSSKLQGIHCDGSLGASADNELYVCIEPWLLVQGYSTVLTDSVWHQKWDRITNPIKSF